MMKVIIQPSNWVWLLSVSYVLSSALFVVVVDGSSVQPGESRTITTLMGSIEGDDNNVRSRSSILMQVSEEQNQYHHPPASLPYRDVGGTTLRHNQHQQQPGQETKPSYNVRISSSRSYFQQQQPRRIQQARRLLRIEERRLEGYETNEQEEERHYNDDNFYYDENENYRQDNVFDHEEDDSINIEYYDEASPKTRKKEKSSNNSSGSGSNSKSTKSSKGEGKGSSASGGKGGDYSKSSPTHPTPEHPAPVPTPHVSPGKYPSDAPSDLNPSDSPSRSPASKPTIPEVPPTRPRVDDLSSRVPTDNDVPTIDVVGGGSSPSSRTPPADGTFRCTTDEEGLYGSQVGFAGVTEYYYQLSTIPSVTAEEVDRSILGSIERVMAGGILERVFQQQCSPLDNDGTPNEPTFAPDAPPTGDSGGTSSSSRADDVTDELVRNGYTLVGDTWVYQHEAEDDGGRRRSLHRRRAQELPPQRLGGFSTEPADVVAQAVECANGGSDGLTLNCFVIRGSLTTYSREKQSNETRQYVMDAIVSSLREETSALLSSDDRLLAVEWRNLTTDPIPDEEDVAIPDEDDAPVDSIGDEGGTNNTAVDGTDAGGTNFGQPWQYVLIALAVWLVMGGAYLCYRRPKSKSSPLMFDGEDSSSTFFIPDNEVAQRSPLSTERNFSLLASLPEEDDDDDQDEGDDSDRDEHEEDNDDDYGYNEKVGNPEDDQQMEEDHAFDGDNFDDEPTVYETTYNDEPYSTFLMSPPPVSSAGGVRPLPPVSGAGRAGDVAAVGFGVPAMGKDNVGTFSSGHIAPLPSWDDEPSRTDSSERNDSNDDDNNTEEEQVESFSYAIQRAMTQGAGAKSDTEFVPFDQMQDDNIYGATTTGGSGSVPSRDELDEPGVGTEEYEFSPTMEMDSPLRPPSEECYETDSSYEEEEIEYEEESFEIA